MKNNKGFTLIELLVTIGLMAALSVVVGLSITNMLSNQHEKEFDEYKYKLEEAACVYVEHEKITANFRVYFSHLIGAGLIDKNLVNPNNDKKVSEDNSSYVQVTWNSGEKKCEYKEE